MFKIEEMTISDMMAYIDNGKLTSAQLVQMYLERIAKYDRKGPGLNAVLEINPDALHIAEAMDYERKYKGKRGALHGIPIIIKDNINTGDKMHTSAGSLALANSYAKDDASLVKRLRDAGAIILGKANMTEFANFMAENMPSGYSSRGGQVINPYDASKTPSGSSSGSGVAVAANLCAAAVGTETDGSILSPSRVNCIVGFKPTVGLISREGIIPISNSQDTAGPMARTVTDAAILLGVMAGVDEKDPATWKSERFSYTDYTQFLKGNSVTGLRVGVCTANYDKFTEEEKSILNETIKALKTSGVEVIEQDKISDSLINEDSSVLFHEFKNGINYYLSTLGSRTEIHTLEDIIAFNNKHADAALKYGQKILELSQQTSGTLTDEKYISDRLRNFQDIARDGIDKAMDELKLDAILFLEGTSIAAVSGYPSIIVPAGFSSDGTSYGITFIGKAFSEPTILRLAYAYEQAGGKRIPPKFD